MNDHSDQDQRPTIDITTEPPQKNRKRTARQRKSRKVNVVKGTSSGCGCMVVVVLIAIVAIGLI